MELVSCDVHFYHFSSGTGGGFGTRGLALASESPMSGPLRACVEAVLACQLMEKLRRMMDADGLGTVFEQVSKLHEI